MNLRTLAENDLALTLEGDWGIPVKLTDPDGVKYETTADDRPLKGQVLWDRVKIDPDTGEEFVVQEPVVTLRKSSLARVPKYGEKWQVEIPVNPVDLETFETYVFDGRTRSIEGGESLGIIRLYPQLVKDK